MSIERKLASIQRVSKIEQHPNADKLEIATILGWKVVVKKGKFKEQDLVVYCEVDSILPEKPEFEFLRNKHFRIKTIKLRGQFSQGICFPLDVLRSDEVGRIFTPNTLEEGQDVTDLLGVTKYEPPAPQCRDAKARFPEWLHRTDQTRIQAVPNVLTRWAGFKFIMSEKLDGSSMTVYYKNGEFGVCSRNLELKEAVNPWWDAAKMLGLPERMKHVGVNVALQGEVLINGNWYYPGRLTFRLFDIYDIDNMRYYPHCELEARAKVYGVETAPQLGTITIEPSVTVDHLVQLATRKSTIQPDKWLEGIVFNPEHEHEDVELGRLSFKVINPEYDLAH